MKKLISALLAVLMVAAISLPAFAVEGEIVGSVDMEQLDALVETEDSIIRPYVFIGEDLFSMSVSNLKTIITTRNSGKVVPNKYSAIGVYADFTKEAKVGVCYVLTGGDVVSVGHTYAKKAANSFTIRPKSGTVHYGFVQNTGSGSFNGTAQFVGMN